MTDKERASTFLKDLRNTTFSISDSEAIPLVLNFIKTIRESEDIIESAFQLGKEAAEANEGFGTCPYNDETITRIWWQRGFGYAARLQRAHIAEQKLEEDIINLQQHTHDPLCESQGVVLESHIPWTVSPIDYRSLLVKYLRYVADEEGSNFIEYMRGFISNVKFTDAERAELRLLDKECHELTTEG